MQMISDPSVLHQELDPLDPSSHYIFKVIARTAAGDGPPIEGRGATLLEGGDITAACLQRYPHDLSFIHNFHQFLIWVSLPFSTTSSRLCVFPVPPSNITISSSNTSVNLSWVPGERDRNHGFHVSYLRKSRKKHEHHYNVWS